MTSTSQTLHHSICCRVSRFLLLSLALVCTAATAAERPTQRQFSIAESPEMRTLRTQSTAGSDLTEIAFDVYGKHFNLQLRSNKRLLNKIGKKLKSREVELLAGKIEGIPNSWVRLSKAKGAYSGAFFDGTELYLIDTSTAARQSLVDKRLRRPVRPRASESVIYKSSAIESIGACGTATSASSFAYQQLLGELNAATANITAAAASSEVEVTLVLDSEYIASGGDPEGHALAQMNVVDGIFSEQVGVKIAIKDIVQLTNNGTLTSTNPLNLLVSFRSYVRNQLGNPGLAHLLTGKNLDSNTVGIAYLDAVCTSWGVGLTQAGVTSSIASLIAAHEIGHNFGAPHDNQSGSACASTSGIYLMNPRINGSDQFSACSLDQMAPTIASASCLNDIDPPTGTAPAFTSSANLTASVGSPYHYDADDTATASGTASISFALDSGPAGMSVNSNGLVTWTPGAAQVGEQSVQISANNSYGSDQQSFVITVSQPPSDPGNPGIDFYTNPPYRYGGSQDSSGSVSVEDGGATLKLEGNRWQAADLPYAVTPSTILEFDFKSTARGEIHAIGFDTDNGINNGYAFELYGSQNWGYRDFSYSGSGSYEHFVIPVGEFYTGSMNKLFFIMDHDVGNPTGNGYFSNVQVYESAASPRITSTPALSATVGQAYSYDGDNTAQATGSAPLSFTLDSGPGGMSVNSNGQVAWTPTATQVGTHAVQITASNAYGSDSQNFSITVSAPADDSVLNFNDTAPTRYGGSQDKSGTVLIEDGGATLGLIGNRWQAADFPYAVTPDTILEFDFKSTAQGEIHAIGFDTNNSLSANRTFKLYGTQNWGNRDFQYSGSGEYEHFVIPVGNYYTGAMLRLFFAMDHDVSNPTGESYFKNITVRE